MQYPLDARADLVGPTVDSNLEQAVPLYRQEDYQIQAAKAPPITVEGKSRPITHRTTHQLRAAPAVVLTRTANQNPANAGQEHQTSLWAVSDPWGPKRSFLGLRGGLGNMGGNAVAVGIGVGLGLLALRFIK